MKTFTLFVIAFAVLAVTLAADPPKSDETSDDLSIDTETDKDTETAGEEKKAPAKPTRPKKSAKAAEAAKKKKEAEEEKIKKETPAPKKKKQVPAPKKKKEEEQEEEDDDDDDADIDLDIEDDEEDKIIIPIPKLLNKKSNPLDLGKKIAGLPEKTKKRYVKTLNTLVKSTEALPFASNFYKAALLAINNKTNAAKKLWNQQNKNAASDPSGLFDLGGILGNGGPLGGIKRVFDANPLAPAGEAGAALFHGAVSDFSRSQSRNSGYFHDMLEHGQGIMETLGKPLEAFPVIGPIKKAIDSGIKSHLPRSRFMHQSSWNGIGNVHAIAHDDSRKTYKNKSNIVRRATGLPLMEDSDNEEEEED